MGVFREIFTWWGGNTIGNRVHTWWCGKLIGADEFGNTYYESRSGTGPFGKPRRWVIYQDIAEASLVPPAWHGWLHYTVDVPPTDDHHQARHWELDHKPNLTGTPDAYRPAGSILTPESRPRVTGDYDAWKP